MSDHNWQALYYQQKNRADVAEVELDFKKRALRNCREAHLASDEHISWGISIISNVSEGDFTKQTEDWQSAAHLWLDKAALLQVGIKED